MDDNINKLTSTLYTAGALTNKPVLGKVAAAIETANYILPKAHDAHNKVMSYDPYYEHMPDNTNDAVKYSFKTSCFMDDMH